MTAICARWNRNDEVAALLASRFAVAARRYGRLPWQDWSDGSVLLGKCLFPLLPEDRHPDPLSEEEPAGRWIVAADVRLSERDDLARQLNLDAAEFSDSALVAAALEQWGQDALNHIYGVFAIIAWDRKDRHLLLARDPLGGRPLYYHAEGSSCTAASMPDVLFADPVIPKEPDTEQYQQFLRMNAFAPGRSAFRNVRTVRPGHVVTVSPDGLEERLWWKPETAPLNIAHQRDYEAALRTALDAAVAACLPRAGGGLGAHLSAGFDSTAVATTAARLLAGKGGQLTAFVAAPREGQQRTMAGHHIADESALAAKTAAMHPNMRLVRLVPRAGPISALHRSRGVYAAPISNLCNLPWFDEINDLARDHGVTVLLHGLQGNTSISESGVWALRELARDGRFGAWLKIARGLVRNGWMRWRGVLFNTFEEHLPDRLWLWTMKWTGQAVDDEEAMTLLSADAFVKAVQAHRTAALAAGEPEPDMDDLGRERGVTSVAYRLSAFGAYGAGDLYKSMLAEWGLDLRDPTADRRLVELALRIPVERLIWNGEPRAILRRVLADRAPPEVLDNRRRGYQGADWAQALCEDRQAFIEEMERLALYEPTAQFLDTAKVHRLIEDMPEPGSAEWDSDEAENSYRLACLRSISAASHMRHIARSNL